MSVACFLLSGSLTLATPKKPPTSMIVFNRSKQETHHAKSGFNLLARKLRVCGKIKNNKREVNSNLLNGCQLFVIGNPQDPFSEEELIALQTYIDGGGSVAIFSSEGGESRSHSNLNKLLQGYGIRIESSSVVRSVYHKYHHPKHALISNGIVQPEITFEKDVLLSNDASTQPAPTQQSQDNEPGALSFVYPNGTTLEVESPSFTLLSSGSTSYPVDCPIAASWEGERVGGRPPGRLLVVGSANLFSDDWIEKEENNQLCNVFFRFLLHQQSSFDPSLGRADEEAIKPCISEEEPLPQDCKSLLIENLYSMKMDHVTDVIDLYKQLNVPYEPLSLIDPHFECPQPPLKMAVHKPRMIEPSPPSLELFDLDEALCDVRTRLGKLASKYHSVDEVDIFIEEAGSICIPDVYDADEWKINGIELSKFLLHHVAREVCTIYFIRNLI